MYKMIQLDFRGLINPTPTPLVILGIPLGIRLRLHPKTFDSLWLQLHSKTSDSLRLRLHSPACQGGRYLVFLSDNPKLFTFSHLVTSF